MRHKFFAVGVVTHRDARPDGHDFPVRTVFFQMYGVTQPDLNIAPDFRLQIAICAPDLFPGALVGQTRR